MAAAAVGWVSSSSSEEGHCKTLGLLAIGFELGVWKILVRLPSTSLSTVGRLRLYAAPIVIFKINFTYLIANNQLRSVPEHLFFDPLGLPLFFWSCLSWCWTTLLDRIIFSFGFSEYIIEFLLWSIKYNNSISRRNLLWLLQALGPLMMNRKPNLRCRCNLMSRQ